MTLNRVKELESYTYYYCNSADGIIDDRLDNEIGEDDILDEFMEIFDAEFEDEYEGSRTFVELLLGRINSTISVTEEEIEEHKLSSYEIGKLRSEFKKYISKYLGI